MSFADRREACVEAWFAEGLSDKTVRGYELMLVRADVWARRRGLDLERLTPSQVRQLAEEWPYSRASRSHLRSALGRLWERSERPDGPILAVPVPSKPRYACRALSEPEAALLARFAAEDPGPGGLAVTVALYAGLRAFEIAKLRWVDVDVDAGWLRVVGKHAVTAELPLHGRLLERLAVADRGSEWVFPSGQSRRGHVHPTTILNWSRELSARALGVPVQTHRLRHTAIATLNDRTGDLRAAQMFARHASPETTQLYTRVTRQRLVSAVEAIEYH